MHAVSTTTTPIEDVYITSSTSYKHTCTFYDYYPYKRCVHYYYYGRRYRVLSTNMHAVSTTTTPIKDVYITTITDN